MQAPQAPQAPVLAPTPAPVPPQPVPVQFSMPPPAGPVPPHHHNHHRKGRHHHDHHHHHHHREQHHPSEEPELPTVEELREDFKSLSATGKPEATEAAKRLAHQVSEIRDELDLILKHLGLEARTGLTLVEAPKHGGRV